MAGFDAPYVPGYDCHGLPIELKVDRELGPKKRDMSIADIRRACRAYAERFIDVMTAEFKRLMVFGDWDHSVPDDELRGTRRTSRARSASSSSAGSSTRARSRSTGASTAAPRSPKPKSSTTITRRRRSTSSFRWSAESARRARRARPGARRTRGLGPDLDDDAMDDSVEPGDRVPPGVRLRAPTTSTAARSSSPRGLPKRVGTGRRPAVRSAGRADEGRAARGHPVPPSAVRRATRSACSRDYVTLEQGTGAVHTAPATARTTS